jgi:hypothetical protein
VCDGGILQWAAETVQFDGKGHLPQPHVGAHGDDAGENLSWIGLMLDVAVQHMSEVTANYLIETGQWTKTGPGAAFVPL